MKFESYVDSEVFGTGPYCYRFFFSCDVGPNHFDELEVWDKRDKFYDFEYLLEADQAAIKKLIKERQDELKVLDLQADQIDKEHWED